MSEIHEIPVQKKVSINQSESYLSRRDFLKFIWALSKYGSLVVIGKVLLDLFAHKIDDVVMLAQCFGAESEKNHLWIKDLKDSYDEALLVVHPGFGLLRFPETYRGRHGYNEYINNLKQTIEQSKNNGDLVVFLVGADAVRTGAAIPGLDYKMSNLAIATNSDNPITISCVKKPDDELLNQIIVWPVDLNNFLREKGVNKVKLAGEFRNACVAKQQSFIEGGGFETELLEDALYSPSEK